MISPRILIADPDGDLLRTYQQVLGEEGFEVETAGDGLTCVARLRDFQPHVLVLDPEIQWGGGEGVLAMIHEDPEVPFLPVVILRGDRRRHENPRSLGVFPVSGLSASLRNPVKRTRSGEPARRIRFSHVVFGERISSRTRARVAGSCRRLRHASSPPSCTHGGIDASSPVAPAV